VEGIYKAIHITGWGIEGKRIPSTEERGSWKVDPVIKQASDLNTITFSDVTFDEIETKLRMEEAQGLFGDILDVRLRGVEHISYHLMNQYTSWRGLEEVVLDMFFQPQMIHDAMSLLEEGHRRILQQLVDQNLLTLNNDSYIFSWKPQPAHLVGNFDENLIRNYLRNTVDVAHQNNCVLEMILKDTHTCEHHPECFDRWMQIAREV